jgi:hypothetical protein
MLPNGASFKLLTALFGGTMARPKFPAHYSWCFATAKTSDMLRTVGFTETQVIPFYGHIYYDKIPLAKQLHAVCARAIAQADVRSLAAFAYTVARKAA